MLALEGFGAGQFGTLALEGWGPGLGVAPPTPTPADNSDPPITGGGRVMPEGAWPQWWEAWEEPQPTEAPPEFTSSTLLLAELAAELGMPKTAEPRQVWQAIARTRASAPAKAEAIVRRVARKQSKRRQLAALLLLRLLD